MRAHVVHTLQMRSVNTNNRLFPAPSKSIAHGLQHAHASCVAVFFSAYLPQCNAVIVITFVSCECVRVIAKCTPHWRRCCNTRHRLHKRCAIRPTEHATQKSEHFRYANALAFREQCCTTTPTMVVVAIMLLVGRAYLMGDVMCCDVCVGHFQSEGDPTHFDCDDVRPQ